MKTIKLVTFDVTGTLLRFQPMPAVVYSQNARDFGINVSADAIFLQFKQQWKKLSDKHPNYGAYSGMGWQKWWKTLIKNTLVKSQPALSYEDKRLDKLSDFLIKEYTTAKWWRLTDGATDILSHLRHADIQTGVISNFDPRLESILEAVGIKEYFQFVITSYAAGVMKPDRRIFKAAESQVSNVQPSSCLHVGNDVDLDYRGAINAGWSAAIISSTLSEETIGQINKQNMFTTLGDLQRKVQLQNYRNL